MGLLKSIQRDPRIARELAQCVEDNQPFRLTDMKLYLTRRCNLRCVMCDAWSAEPPAPAAEAQGDGHAELSTAEVLRVIDQARPLGLAILKLFGGEPMLRRDLEVIVEHAATLGIRCTLITNGTLLTEQRARRLVEAGLAQLDLSLDAGDAGLHDAIRGVPGTWRRATQGLQAVQAAAHALKRRVAIRVNAVVMRANYLGLPKLVGQLSSLAVDEITLSPVVPQAANRRETARRVVLEPADIAVYNAEVAAAIAGQAPAYRLSKSRDCLYLYGTSQQDIEHASEGATWIGWGLRAVSSPGTTWSFGRMATSSAATRSSIPRPASAPSEKRRLRSFGVRRDIERSGLTASRPASPGAPGVAIISH